MAPSILFIRSSLDRPTRTGLLHDLLVSVKSNRVVGQERGQGQGQGRGGLVALSNEAEAEAEAEAAEAAGMGWGRWARWAPEARAAAYDCLTFGVDMMGMASCAVIASS